MHLKKLSLVNFKNYDSLELTFSPRINCITGNNGVGKTNIMDAVYYLSFCKSYFNPIDSQNIKHEQDALAIQGEFDRNQKTEKIFCGIKRKQKKKFTRNKKEYSRLAEHIGLLPLVMITPTDSELITEGSEVRRKLVDSIISQYQPTYLDNLLKYNKALMHRNALLKQFAQNLNFNKEALNVWNEQLMFFGNQIHDERKNFIIEFTPSFQKYYNEIGNEQEVVSLEYQSQLNNSTFEELLESHLNKDRKFQFTTAGVHKDDFVFNLNDYAVKKFASQGQQKSYVLALKLGQADFIHEKMQVVPILLLDDIYDKLDAFRVGKLAEIICSGNFGQVFITDAHPDRSKELFDGKETEMKMFEIKSPIDASKGEATRAVEAGN